MSDIAVHMENVYKRFRKGEALTSLRDLIPALTGRMFGRPELSQRDKREFWALQDISLEVKRGDAFGIIGHNGAGKSTILKLLSHIMKPTKGTIVVNGRVSALIEVSAGFHQDLTGRENIFLNGTILGMTKREIKSKLDQIIAFSELEEFIDTPVKRYSTGMHARLGYSIAAHVDSDILIVDEVLSVGDALFQRKCVEHMKSIMLKGTTVLFVSHNLATVGEFCSHSLLLAHGRSVATGPTHKVLGDYMTLLREHRAADHSRPVVVSKFSVRGGDGPCSRFQSGERAWIDIEVSAYEPCSKLAIAIYFLDKNHYLLFSTSTERLRHGNVSLNTGDIVKCTFELVLNLGPGVYYPSVQLYRYDNQNAYDNWRAADTIYVSTNEDMTGPVNCFPRVVRQQLFAAAQHDTNSHSAEECASRDNITSLPNAALEG